jgi:type II secretory pathway component PulK
MVKGLKMRSRVQFSSCKFVGKSIALSNEKGGVALVLVIWIMVILLALVGEFSYSMRTEMKITRNFKEEEEAYQLALAGIEQAKIELLSVRDLRTAYVNENDVLVFFNESDTNDTEGEETERSNQLGRGNFEYTIIDEDGKVNINTAKAEQLRRLFLDSGVDTEDVSTIVDSILDWRDENSLHRLNGAEEDYYTSLERPYSCKDGPFSTIEELLLVKGMTPEIYFGSAHDNVTPEDQETEESEEEEESYRGVAGYLTVKGSELININTAQLPVLEATFGAVVADNIMIQRENGPIKRPVGKSKVDSTLFTIISTGKNYDESITRTVKVLLQRQANDLVTLYWSDNSIE